MDIDIDLKTTFDPHKHFNVVNASMVTDNVLKKHPCGVYFQTMPQDPITSFAAIPHKQAEAHGFMKIDFLHLQVLDFFHNKREIRALIKKPPRWGMLLKSDVVGKLFQLHKNGDILRRIQPKSILELADCISIIRPGKLYLLDDYVADPTATRPILYEIKKGSYSYKKGHAISYAMIVVLQLHLIEAGVL